MAPGNVAAATGLRALNTVPAVNKYLPRWATPLDLLLMTGCGNIRWVTFAPLTEIEYRIVLT
jgi:hypothetical protein